MKENNWREELSETISLKINHSWDGKLFAQNDNTLEWIDVTEEIKEELASARDETEREVRDDLGESISNELPEWGFTERNRIREFLDQWFPNHFKKEWV